MKFNSVALTLATAGSLATAQHHHRFHHHANAKREPQAAAPTVLTYELNGQLLPADAVCKGIAEGLLEFAGSNIPDDACKGYLSSSSAAAASSSTPTPTPSVPASSFSSSATPSSVAFSSSATPSSVASSSSSAAASASPSSSSILEAVEREFPDGELDCDTFPSDYGALALDYLGLQGWSGIQYVDIIGEAISNIVTAVTGDKCTHGAMCSYACPPGYQKSQWPSEQGTKGQSVGGIACKGGKLHLTNPGLSKKLCIPGTGGVASRNALDESVSVCRTDYPGTEGETIPVSVASGQTQPLACPNGNHYFKWLGKVTTAQYYVNNKGVPIQEACQWGNGNKPVGNWAPLNLGVGESDSGKWLSMFKNSPTTDNKLNFNVRIDGDGISGTCKYENGHYITDSGTNDNGCTIKVLSGNATYVFYD